MNTTRIKRETGSGKLDLAKWIVTIIIMTVASGILSILSVDDLVGALPHETLGESIDHRIQCLESIIKGSGVGSAFCEGSSTTSLSTISKKIHALPDFIKGGFQILAVIAASYLWFLTFKLGRPHLWVLSMISSVIFIFGMFPAYQPAVFVAALVAIYVAAEHYDSLSEQTTKMGQQGEKVNDMVGKMGTVLEKVNGMVEPMGVMLENVTQIANSTQLSLNPAGLEIFLQRVFGAYSRANVVYAIVRDHRIPSEWWNLTKGIFKNYDIGSHQIDEGILARVWQKYESPRDSAGATRKLTLFHALTEARQVQIGMSGQTVSQNGVSAAYFVTAMPLPYSDEWPAQDDKKACASLFSDLLGLVWECLILDRVRAKLQLQDSIGHWVSRPLCWMHATDLEVWQVIKRKTFAESNVMQIADLTRTESNRLDLSMSRRTIEFSHAEIRQYLQRGVPAHEYLCSILSFAMKNDAGTKISGYESTAMALKEIFIGDWLDLERNRRNKALLYEICVHLFWQFIQRFVFHKIGDDQSETHNPESSLILARGFL